MECVCCGKIKPVPEFPDLETVSVGDELRTCIACLQAELVRRREEAAERKQTREERRDKKRREKERQPACEKSHKEFMRALKPLMRQQGLPVSDDESESEEESESEPICTGVEKLLESGKCEQCPIWTKADTDGRSCVDA